ncbi:unnamed protein product [Discosporangium mesarthrocarpum]
MPQCLFLEALLTHPKISRQATDPRGHTPGRGVDGELPCGAEEGGRHHNRPDQELLQPERRLLLCGFKCLVYLLEGDLDNNRKVTTGKEMGPLIRTVEAETQMQGFAVKRTQHKRGTAAFLLCLSRQILRSQGRETVASYAHSPRCAKVPLHLFEHLIFGKCAGASTRLGRLHEIFRCLATVLGVGSAGALAIVQKFPTLQSLLAAMDGCQTAQEQEGLLQLSLCANEWYLGLACCANQWMCLVVNQLNQNLLCIMCQYLRLEDGGKKGSTRTIEPTAARRIVSLFTTMRLGCS